MTSVPNFQCSPLPALTAIQVSGFSTEDVLVADNGAIFTGVEDGRVLQIEPAGTEKEIANTDGRPLGLEFMPDNRLLICDATKGVLAVTLDSGDVEVLVAEFDGKPIPFCNNAAVAKDGTVYFSSSSSRYGIDRATIDIIEYVPTGRLFKRSPDGHLEVLLDDLYFANGVALTQNEDAVLVAETGRAAINRIWLKGDKAGQHDQFVDELPGLPDNISLGSDGNIWVGLVADNDAMVSSIRKLPRWLRKMIARLPEFLKPSPPKKVVVIAFDESGNCQHYFEGSDSRFHMATGVRENNGTVWLGSLMHSSIARFDLG